MSASVNWEDKVLLRWVICLAPMAAGGNGLLCLCSRLFGVLARVMDGAGLAQTHQSAN